MSTRGKKPMKTSMARGPGVWIDRPGFLFHFNYCNVELSAACFMLFFLFLFHSSCVDHLPVPCRVLTRFICPSSLPDKKSHYVYNYCFPSDNQSLTIILDNYSISIMCNEGFNESLWKRRLRIRDFNC